KAGRVVGVVVRRVCVVRSGDEALRRVPVRSLPCERADRDRLLLDEPTVVQAEAYGRSPRAVLQRRAEARACQRIVADARDLAMGVGSAERDGRRMAVAVEGRGGEGLAVPTRRRYAAVRVACDVLAVARQLVPGAVAHDHDARAGLPVVGVRYVR